MRILVYHIFAIVCPLLNPFLDSLQAFDCFVELKSGVKFEYFVTHCLIHLAGFEVRQSRPVVSFEGGRGKVDHAFHGDAVVVNISTSGLPSL